MLKRLRGALGGLFGRRGASTTSSRDASISVGGIADRQTGAVDMEVPPPVAAPVLAQTSDQSLTELAQAATGKAPSSTSHEMSSDAGVTDNMAVEPAPGVLVTTQASREADVVEDEDEDEGEDAVQRRGRPGKKRRPLEADRVWFGEELWGVSARHRKATFNAEKLGRFGLPLLATERDLAEWLGISVSRLRWYTHDRPADTTWHYIRHTVPKRSGGERVILAPKRELKALQRKVMAGILAGVPTSASAHGFVRRRSIVTNARSHVGKQAVLKLDLKDFFPSITYPRVRGLFISLGYSFVVGSALALLCTEYEREAFERDGVMYFISIGRRHLVQGAPTSPALANLVAWRLDRRLDGLATKHGFVYTRYADDLTFSGDNADLVHRIRVATQYIATDEHFEVNTAKTRIARRSARQIVTGLVVNDQTSTPRELRRRLRAILHNARASGLAAQNRDGRVNYAHYLQGLIAFVHAASPEHARRLRGAFRLVAGDEQDTQLR